LERDVFYERLRSNAARKEVIIRKKYKESGQQGWSIQGRKVLSEAAQERGVSRVRK